MSYKVYHLIRTAGDKIVLAALILGIAATAPAQSTEATANSSVGLIDFEAANLPPANVEVDLSQEMFRDLFSIGDAAIAGVAEAVLNASEDGTNARKEVKLAAEQIEAARQIVEIFGKVVREVRVRAYESLPEETNDARSLFKPFDAQLKDAKWETVVRVRDDEQVVRVSVLRKDGSIRGVFVTATDGDSVVLANIVCDISPERIKPLTAAAAKIGLKANFQPMIQLQLSQTPGEVETRSEITIRNAAPAEAPVPPVPPAPPAPAVK